MLTNDNKLKIKGGGGNSNFQDEIELHQRKTNFRSLQYRNTGVSQAYQTRWQLFCVALVTILDNQLS